MRLHEISESYNDDLLSYMKTTPEKPFDSDAEYGFTHNHLELKSKKLINNKLLVHFSENAEQIAQQGFRFGVDQMDRLGVTRWIDDEHKNRKGYNFAFDATSSYAKTTASFLTYGKGAVVFRAGGVHCWHRDDREEQVIFWGADVKPSSMVVITNEDGDRGEAIDAVKWSVLSRGKPVFSGSYIACIKFISLKHNISESVDFMSLDPWSFDQTPNGWRSLPDIKEKLKVLLTYIKKYLNGKVFLPDTPKGQKEIDPSILYFHAGQLFAMLGNDSQAIVYFKRSLNDDSEWSNYVQATIAFLNKDRASFDRCSKLVKHNQPTMEQL